MQYRLRQMLLALVFNLSMLSFSPVMAAFTLDVDDDGHLEPLTDGLLIMRYLFGFSGDALTRGALAIDARRTEADRADAR